MCECSLRQYNSDKGTEGRGTGEGVSRPGEDSKGSGGEWGEDIRIRNQTGAGGAGESGIARRIVDQIRGIGTRDWGKPEELKTKAPQGTIRAGGATGIFNGSGDTAVDASS